MSRFNVGRFSCMGRGRSQRLSFRDLTRRFAPCGVVVRSLCALMSTAAFTVPAHSQGWSTLPNGNLAYVIDYTTTGMFTCNQFPPPNGCFASGNSVTLVNGTAALTYTFMGVTGAPLVVETGTGRTTPFKLGTLVATRGGTGVFSFPLPQSLNAWYMQFHVGLTTTMPVAGSTAVGSDFVYRNGKLERASVFHYGDGRLPLVPPPLPTVYSEFNILRPRPLPLEPLNATSTASIDIFAEAQIIPEPATIILVATGLVGVAGAVRHRRRRRQN